MTVLQARPQRLRVDLYRADRRPGLNSIGGEVRSWTTSIKYARQYQAGYYGPRFGGPVLYRGRASIDLAKTTDLRTAEARQEVGEALLDVLDILGVDDIADYPLHALLQEAVPVLRSLGRQWIVFHEDGYDHDEWLSLGNRVRVEELS